MAHEHLINAREYEQTLSFIEDYHLAEHDASLARLLAVIRAQQPTAIDRQLWQSVRSRVAAFEQFHQRAYPFLVAPPATLDDRPIRTPLRQAADGQRLTLNEAELAEHIGIFGRSGGGKTTCAQQFAHEAYRRGLTVVIIDGKHDARAFPLLYPDTIVIDRDTPVPVMETAPWLSPSESRRQITKPLRETMWGGEGLEQVATESHQHAVTKDRPSIADWRDEVRKLARKGDTYNRRDRCDGLALRLDRLISQYPGIGTTKTGEGISLEDLCTKSVYFGFGIHTEIEDFITQWLIELRFSYNRARNLRTLNTFILLDESNLLIHDRTIAEQAPLVATFPLLREFGIAVCLTANNYRSIPAPIRSSLNLQISMNLTDAAEASDVAKTFGLTDGQRQYLDTKLTRGMCIAKLADRWKHPFLAQFDGIAIDKSIDTEAWQEAVDRTKRLSRAAREESLAQQATAQPSPSASHASTAPLIKPKIALNTHAEALLRYACTKGVTTTTSAFADLNLHPQAGMRAKKQLFDIALIEEERITIRHGRGATAVAIRPTAVGYERASIKRHGTRGGDSIQHEYLVRELAKRIKNVRIDATVGRKACDLLFPFTDVHANVAVFCNITPAQGELVAIEVEVSDPRRTAPNNIARNAEAGVPHTIIATMTPLHCKGAVVVDVFELLEAL